jgi:superfamily II DNA or RNA helicase
MFMHQYELVYRFIVEEKTDLTLAQKELKLLLERENNLEQSMAAIKHQGDRNTTHIDPTPTESGFESAFFDLYGQDSYNKILREASFLDVYGTERYYDYLIELNEPRMFIAIEQNGIMFHHPGIVGKERYRKQLSKQNSFLAGGNKLFRWSVEGMIDYENFADDIKRYLGDSTNFLTVQHIKAPRAFKLYEHQEHLLSELSRSRSAGKQSFLIVLPTGTGKTAILMDDLASHFHRKPLSRVLIIEPTIHMCRQIGVKIKLHNLPSDRIEVHTYAWMSQHYRVYDPAWFNYVAVDEAHHAVAPSIQRVIQHFTADVLIGMTATDQRPDKKKLEHIFGEYDTHMSLKEAILKGILAPIRAFRIKSSLDFSSIRYNGKDYAPTDLQKHVIIDSRDQLIVDILKKYFASDNLYKQGVIFCVSVNHAKRMAARLKNNGISAEAVSGESKKTSLEHLEQYQKGSIQFLTTCSLIHEGWDSPRTSVIVMARPTMSKVLYTQQLGRGTRRFEGKEALYVLDVVDNYGPMNNPWNIHSLMNMPFYKPWADILEEEPEYGSHEEEIILAGLYEQERKIEEINIFTFEKAYGDFLSTEQLARELFVSTGTVNNWIRKGEISSDVTVPFGRSQLRYFKPSRVAEIRKVKDLRLHDESTMIEDFHEFLEKRDYTYSYKIVFLLAFLSLADDTGCCSLDELTKLYSSYYRKRLDAGLPVDRKGCPYTHDYVDDTAKMKNSILRNPFEKFERKRFMFHQKPDKAYSTHMQTSGDLNTITIHHVLWDHLSNQDIKQQVNGLIHEDLKDYYKELGGMIPFTFEK